MPKLAILTDSHYLQLGATGKARHWKSKGWTTMCGKLQVQVPVWEMLLQEMAKPGREVRWEHVPTHVTARGMRWQMDWRWKACVRARCGLSMLHHTHH